jgi:hypothetical protein
MWEVRCRYRILLTQKSRMNFRFFKYFLQEATSISHGSIVWLVRTTAKRVAPIQNVVISKTRQLPGNINEIYISELFLIFSILGALNSYPYNSNETHLESVRNNKIPKCDLKCILLYPCMWGWVIFKVWNFPSVTVYAVSNSAFVTISKNSVNDRPIAEWLTGRPID